MGRLKSENNINGIKKKPANESINYNNGNINTDNSAGIY